MLSAGAMVKRWWLPGPLSHPWLFRGQIRNTPSPNVTMSVHRWSRCFRPWAKLPHEFRLWSILDWVSVQSWLKARWWPIEWLLRVPNVWRKWRQLQRIQTYRYCRRSKVSSWTPLHIHHVYGFMWQIDAAEVNFEVALAVMNAAEEEGVSRATMPNGSKRREWARSKTWTPTYAQYEYSEDGFRWLLRSDWTWAGIPQNTALNALQAFSIDLQWDELT